MRFKKGLSIFALLCLLLQLMVPCFAAEATGPSIKIEGRKLTEEERSQFYVTDENVYGVFFYADGGTAENTALGISLLNTIISYDASIISAYNSYDNKTVENAADVNGDCVEIIGTIDTRNTKYQKLTVVAKETSDGFITVNCGCLATPDSLRVKDPQTLYVLFFKIKDNDESQLNKGSIRIETNEDNLVLVQTKVPIVLNDGNGAAYEYKGTTATATQLDDSAISISYPGSDKDVLTATTINNKGSLTLAVPDQTTGTASLPLTVSNTGLAGTYTGSETATTTWSIIKDENNTGAQIDGSTLKITNTGKAGTVTVQASTVAGGEPKTDTADVTITKAPSEVESITVTPGTASLDIPVVDTPETTTFSATVKDQYGEGSADGIVWSIADAPDGVSIDASTGKVSVTKEAKDSIAKPQEFTVTASLGGKTGSAKLTVARAGSVATTVAVEGKDSVTVPTSGSETETYEAVVYDQYGAEMTNQSATWSVSTNSLGVTIAADTGVLSVPYAAPQEQAVKVTVTATVSEKAGSKEVSVVWDRSARNVEIVEENDKQNGTTDPNGYTIVIPAAGQTTLELFARADDKYGNEIDKPYDVTWGGTLPVGMYQADGDKITITVKAGVEPVEYELTATVNGVKETTQIKVIDKIPLTMDITGLSVTGAGKTYDGTAVSQSGNAVAKLGDDTKTVTIDYTWEKADGTKLENAPKDAGSYKLVATVNDTTYAGSAFIEFTIEKKSVTVTSGITAADKTYDGNTDAELNVSGAQVTGKVGSDDVTVASADGAFADKNVGTGKSVAISNIVLGGTAAGNYVLAGTGNQTEATANITAKELTLDGGTVTIKEYDGTDTAAVTAVTFEGLVEGETLALTTDYTVADAKFANADAGSGKNVTATVTLVADGPVAKNYTLSNGVLTATGEITKATITGFQTTAPSHTILANDAANKSIANLKTIANSGSDLPTTVTVTYGSGKTAELSISWADAAETFNPKGGTYTFKGTVVPGGNFNAYADTLDATVTVTPVKVTAITTTDDQQITGGTLSKNQVTGAADLAALGIPAQVKLVYDQSGVAADTIAAAWDRDLAAVKAEAGKVTETQDGSITLTLTADNIPAWATVDIAMPAVTLKITNKQPIPASDITFENVTVTYGTDYTSQLKDASVNTSAHPEYADVDFTYTYNGSETLPTDAGIYTITVTAENANYKGTKDATLTIEQKALTADMLTIDPVTYTYTGSSIEAKYTVSDKQGEKELITTDDYTVEFSSNKNAGEATLTVKAAADGNYKGEVSKTFTIAPKSLTAEGITISGLPAEMTYTGSPIEPAVTVKDGQTVLTDADYNVTYSDGHTNVGKVTVTVTGEGNYKDSKTAEFQIVAAAASGVVTITGTNYEVGTELTASVTGKTDSKTYQWYRGSEEIENATNEKYTLTAEDAGAQISVKVTSSGNYVGVLESAAITVGKAPLTGTVTLSRTDNTITADVETAPADSYDIVWLRDGQVISGATGTTYTVTDADKGHTISAKLVAKGDYTGEIASTGNVAVAAAKPSAPVVTATAGNAQITVSWTAQDNGSPITQYQIQLGSDPVITLDAATTSYTFTGLTNDDSYTVQVWAINAVGTSAPGSDTATPVAPSSGGISGGGVTTYPNTVESTANGTVTVSPKNASQGTSVTITVKPDEGYVLDTITVTDKDGKAVEVTKVSDTQYTFKMPASAVTVKASFKEETPAVSDLPFTDVAESAWYYDAVAYVYENGMMTGTNDGTTFSPAMSLTRGMIAQVMFNIEQGTAPAAGSFTDVAAGAWYADAVNWAAANGIVGGYGNGTFGPEDSITREQMAVLLYNYARFKGYDMTATTDLSSFSDDEKVSDWALYAMKWAVAEGLISGSNNALNPLGTASRAEVAQILMNFGQNVAK